MPPSFDPEPFVGRGEVRRDSQRHFVPGSTGRSNLVVDGGLRDRQLLACQSQLLRCGGGVLFEGGQLEIERLQRLHDLQLLILDLSTLSRQRRRLLPHRLLVAIRPCSPGTQTLLDRHDPSTHCLRPLVEDLLLGSELVALLPSLDDAGLLLGEARAELRDRRAFLELATTVCETVER